jgi:hypothetical protein
VTSRVTIAGVRLVSGWAVVRGANQAAGPAADRTAHGTSHHRTSSDRGQARRPTIVASEASVTTTASSRRHSRTDHATATAHRA